MNITTKIDRWNETLIETNIKIKQVADQASGTHYYEIAKYKDDNSLTCKLINGIKKKIGLDLRFTFLNIGKVIFTTKHERNLEDFINDFKFDICKDGFAYEGVTIKEYDSARRSAALDKVMSKELPIKLEPKSPTPGYAVELDSFQKSSINDFSKPSFKNKVKIVKSDSFERGR
jgi:hypothetical protein